MKNRTKLKSYCYCTGLVKCGEHVLTVILKQSFQRFKQSGKQINENESFITEQINVNTS